jgi:YVTN family beta-propeller protein
MRRWLFCLVALMATPVSAPWLEKTVYLPDSFPSPAYPNRIFYNPNNNTVFIFGNNSSQICVLDGATNRKIASIQLPGTAGKFSYNPGDNKLYILSGSQLFVIDAAANRFLRTVQLPHYGYDLTYNPNSNRIYCVGHYSAPMVWVVDCDRDSVVQTISIPYHSNNIACAYRVNKVYCVMDNDDVAVIDCSTDSVIKTFYSGTGPYGMLYNHLTNRLYIAEDYDEDISVVDCDRDTVIRWLVAGYRPRLMCLNTVSNKFYCADWRANWFGVYDALADTLIRWIYLNTDQQGLVFDSLDNLVYVALSATDSIAVVDGVTNEVVRIVPTPGSYPAGLGYNPRANLIYAAELNSHQVVIYNARTSEVVNKVPTMFPVNILAYLSGSERVYCASIERDEIVPVDAATGTIHHPIKLPAAPSEIIPINESNRLYALIPSATAIVSIDCPAETVRKTIPLYDTPNSAIYVQDLNRLFCTLPEDIAIINCARDSVIDWVYGGADPRILGYLPNLHRLYLSAILDQYSLVALDVLTQRIIADIGLGGKPLSVCYLPEDNALACAVENLNGLFFVDCATHTIRSFLPMPYHPDLMFYNQFRNRLYCAAGSQFYVINPSGPRIEDSVPIGRSLSQTVYDSLTGYLYCTFRYGQSVKVFDCRTDSVVTVIDLPHYPAAIVHSPSQRRVYASVPNSSVVCFIRDTTVVGLAPALAGDSNDRLIPTVVRYTLPLPKNETGVLFDIFGRKVLILQPGVNDIRHLAPGVYFIQPMKEVTPGKATIKVLITR